VQSQMFKLSAAVAAMLKALCDARGVGWLDNPPLPLDMGGKPDKVLFILGRGDKLLDQPGAREERRLMRLVVGAVALSANARAEADELHFAARDTLKSLSLRRALLDAGGARDVREVEIEPELRDMASPGATVMSAYEIEYTQTYPSFDL
jgi:hypothetical protein